jgi:hypothetical protein
MLTAAAVSFARAQQSENNLSIATASGLRMVQHGDAQRPAVAVFLPSAKEPAAVIEMPEHAWRKEKESDQQTWFYRMYTADPALRGQVGWSKQGNTLSYAMTAASGFRLNCRAALDDEGIAIDYEIVSSSIPQVAAAQAVTCMKLYRPFTDVFLERTYVHHAEGIELIAAETPDRLRKNAEEWLPCRYIVRVGKGAPAAPYRVEKQDGVTRYFKSSVADAPFLATESEPHGWTAATHTLTADSVFTNPARTCHHTDPIALGLADGRARLGLKVYMVRGTPEDAWNIIAKRERERKA